MPKYVLTSNAFIYCLASHKRYHSGSEHVFAFNLFRNPNEAQSNKRWARELASFLRRDNNHGAVSRSKLTFKKIYQKVKVCAADSASRESYYDFDRLKNLTEELDLAEPWDPRDDEEDDKIDDDDQPPDPSPEPSPVA